MFAKTIFAAAAATLLTTAATAGAPIDSDAGLGKAPTATARADRPDQRYCIESEVTGSRIARRTCDSLSAWQDQGVDPRLLPRRR